MPAPERTLRVGILGAGWVAGDRHVRAYRRHPAAEVVAVCDREAGRAEVFARRHNVPHATDSLADFLATGLDLVSVCTPPFAHRDEAIAALDAGCAVFVEKPMAMDPGDARAMADAATRNARLLCVSHNVRFSRAMRRLRRVLDSGAAGPVEFVVGAQVSSPRRRLPAWYPQLPAGLFFDESPHLLYLLDWLLDDLRLVAATAARNDAGSAQPIRSLHAVFSSAQAPATLTMVFEGPVSEWHLVVVCRHRVLMADLFRDIAIVLGPDDAHGALDILRTTGAAALQHGIGFAASGLRVAARRQSWGHDRLIHRVVDAALTGGPSPVPVAEALRVVELTAEILHAIR